MTLSLPLCEKVARQLAQVRAFFAANYPEVRLYAVGGAVRDALTGREVSDLDIECFGLSPEAFDEAMGRLGALGVGRSFFVYKYGAIDIALPRIERKVAEGHRGFAVALARDTREASRRRDFTMNALMLDLQSGEVIDHWGGVADIRRRLIRVVDPARFVEDSLRVLRAMQFSARLGFRIEPESRDLMARMALDDLSGERIFWEFEKLFWAERPHFGLRAMIELGIDRKIFGFAIEKGRFWPLTLSLVRGVRHFRESSLRPYLFLYLLSTRLHRNAQTLCEAIHAPGRYRKILATQKAIPRRITDRFLGALALDRPIGEWLGAFTKGVASRAGELGIYDKVFDPGIRAGDLLAEGLRGKALGEALRRRRLDAVRQSFGRRGL